MNNQENIQLKLLDQINKIIPPSISLVDELAELLDISVDSAYRRLRGETFLTINETVKLCNKYRISFDSLIESTDDIVTFDFKPMVDETSYKRYLTSILEDLKLLKNYKQLQAIFAAKDIPLFHDFNYPTLGAFKIFYWMKSIMNLDSFQGVKFDPKIIDSEILEIGKEVYNNYSSIPTIEVWTEITPIGLFKQIEFFWDSGIFQSKDDAIAVCEDVRQEIALIEKQAEIGQKIDSKGNAIADKDSYLLYWSDVEIANNCIFVEIEDEKLVYLAFNTFNRLFTRNKYFCGEIEKWLKILIKKSNLISGVSERKRYQFFKKINQGIDELCNKITSN